VILALALVLAGERAALGVWERWGALRDTNPVRCFAIAQPVAPDGGTDRRGAFASVAATAGGGRALYLRLSRPRGAGAPLTLAIDERRFALIGDTVTARAPDAATDRAIVAAMRGARAMTVTTLDARGRTLADTYALAGAATAIDAAALGCLKR
jgi:hypothetical protein